jgi:hypothetical protein
MRTRRILTITICLAVAAVACSSTEEETSTTAPPTTATTAAPTTTAPPTTTAAEDFSSEDALGVADAYFAANGAGDFDALRALFVADPAFTGQFGIADDEQLFAWNVAQGSTVSPPECAAVDGAVEETMTVNCTTFNHDVLVQAVDGPPVPIRLTLTITSEGIVEENGSFGQPDFNTVGEPFDDWMNENHPDEVDAIGFGNWTTIEEAEQNGTLTAQYATEWATYLQANSCAYNQGC